VLSHAPSALSRWQRNSVASQGMVQETPAHALYISFAWNSVSLSHHLQSPPIALVSLPPFGARSRCVLATQRRTTGAECYGTLR